MMECTYCGGAKRKGLQDKFCRRQDCYKARLRSAELNGEAEQLQKDLRQFGTTNVKREWVPNGHYVHREVVEVGGKPYVAD